MDSKDIDIIKKALIKDFNDLYQKEYCTDYKEKRLIRGIEIEIMDFDNLIKAFLIISISLLSIYNTSFNCSS